MIRTLSTFYRAGTLLVAIACAGWIGLSVSYGQQPGSERYQAAETLVDSTETEESLFDTLEATLDQQTQQFAQMGISPEGIAEIKAAMLNFFRKVIQWDEMKPEIVQLYAESFTTDELIELTAFYQSPLGKKTLQVTPQLMAKSAAVGQRFVEENQAELQATLIPIFQKYLGAN